MSEVPAEALALQVREQEVFRGDLTQARVVDEQALKCKFAGHPTMLLHYCGGPKPWEGRAWRQVRYQNAYIRLLRRLLIGKDVAISTPANELPPWLRSGILGQMSFSGLIIFNEAIPFAKSITKRFLKKIVNAIGLKQLLPSKG